MYKALRRYRMESKTTIKKNMINKKLKRESFRFGYERKIVSMNLVDKCDKIVYCMFL